MGARHPPSPEAKHSFSPGAKRSPLWNRRPALQRDSILLSSSQGAQHPHRTSPGAAAGAESAARSVPGHSPRLASPRRHPPPRHPAAHPQPQPGHPRPGESPPRHRTAHPAAPGSASPSAAAGSAFSAPAPKFSGRGCPLPIRMTCGIPCELCPQKPPTRSAAQYSQRTRRSAGQRWGIVGEGAGPARPYGPRGSGDTGGCCPGLRRSSAPGPGGSWHILERPRRPVPRLPQLRPLPCAEPSRAEASRAVPSRAVPVPVGRHLRSRGCRCAPGAALSPPTADARLAQSPGVERAHTDTLTPPDTHPRHTPRHTDTPPTPRHTARHPPAPPGTGQRPRRARGGRQGDPRGGGRWRRGPGGPGKARCSSSLCPRRTPVPQIAGCPVSPKLWGVPDDPGGPGVAAGGLRERRGRGFGAGAAAAAVPRRAPGPRSAAGSLMTSVTEKKGCPCLGPGAALSTCWVRLGRIPFFSAFK